MHTQSLFQNALQTRLIGPCGPAHCYCLPAERTRPVPAPLPSPPRCMLPLPGWEPAICITLLALLAPAALMALWRRSGARRLSGGTHVLITGGSKGLGLALARQCAQRGCSVTVVARNQADLDAALQLQREAALAAGADHAGQRLQALAADTADLDKVGWAGRWCHRYVAAVCLSQGGARRVLLPLLLSAPCALRKCNQTLGLNLRPCLAPAAAAQKGVCRGGACGWTH